MLLNQKFLLGQVRRVALKPTYRKLVSHFRRSFSGWAIDHFKELVHDGKFIPDNMFHTECIWFVYAQFI